MTAPISNEPTTTRLHHYAGRYSPASRGDDGFTRVTDKTGGGGGAWPGRETMYNTISTPGAAGVEGAGGSGGPGCGACGRWQGLAGLRTPSVHQVPPVWRAPEGTEGQAAVPVGGGGAWPGFETTRRAKLAARTARGRAAAHGHTKQPGPTKHARRPEHQRQQRPGIQKTDIRIGCRPVVELGGFEPPTFSLRTRRATNCAIAPRTRTA